MGRFLATLLWFGWVAVAGCSLLSPGTIDGWEYAGPVDCFNGIRAWCEEFLDVAQEGFDEGDPLHPPVVRRQLHEPAKLAARSGGPIYVAVFRLADGSVRAIGVGNLGISGPAAFDAPNHPQWPGGRPPP